MAYTNNAFCWHGVISTDTAAARDFYTQVLPWTAVDAEMGGDTVTMFAAGDCLHQAQTRSACGAIHHCLYQAPP